MKSESCSITILKFFEDTDIASAHMDHSILIPVSRQACKNLEFDHSNRLWYTLMLIGNRMNARDI
jgi:hypothetical protein